MPSAGIKCGMRGWKVLLRTIEKRRVMTNKKNQVIRTSLGLKDEVLDDLEKDYKSPLVEKMKQEGNRLSIGNFNFHIAQEFGFCYGVEKTVDFAYQTIKKFPDKKIYTTSEMIHNPRVNLRLRDLGVEFLDGQYSQGKSLNDITEEDVVLIPAFGLTPNDLERLKEKGCILVDTTCGSVVHVWKRVERYAKEGFTSLIHGKYNHEETIATSSHVTEGPGGHFIVVRDMPQTQTVCDYIENGGDKDKFLEEFKLAVSEGFDPDKHLPQMGVANQTTMLSSESLEIAEKIKQSLSKRYGSENINEHFRSFDTICSATQERQDAILELAQSKTIDLILVIGGYNSSNTTHLAELSLEYHPAFHIQEASEILSLKEIRHQPIGKEDQVVESGWLPQGKVSIGLTAGASTPNRVIEDVIQRLIELSK